MINRALWHKEMKSSLKLMSLFIVVLTMYISIIVTMYNPVMMNTLANFYKMMPTLLSAVGMRASANTLLGFLVSYLYGFILIVFPMIYMIILAMRLVAKYINNHSLSVLLSAPVSRLSIILTQWSVLVGNIILLVSYVTLLEWGVAYFVFPNALSLTELIFLNSALLCLYLAIGSLAFLASCLSAKFKMSVAFGAGTISIMFILQMLAQASEKVAFLKYFTFFTLFDPNGIITHQSSAWLGASMLLLIAIIVYTLAIQIFCHSDFNV